MESARVRLLWRIAWALVAIPALLQLALLLYTVVKRYSYPYDLEWMEGGVLVHAQRIADGDGIYVPPSMEFIPYLYTPLYPGLVATAGTMVGISYQLGRAISILSLLGLFWLVAWAIVRESGPDDRRPAWCGAALGAGVFAATYPWVDGWFDLVRADTLFLFMVSAGLLAVHRYARADVGWPGHLRIGAAAAILALSFFCKQTGILYVAAGGALLLVRNWRRLPTYVAVAGAIGLGGTWLLDRTTDGWFWIYVFKVHQAHDFNKDRVWASFPNILWHFPAMTVVIGIALLAVAVAALRRRRLAPAAGPLLVWSYLFAVSVVVGAVGWGTQWAHFNAYMPAMLTGGIAAGAAVPALCGSARILLSVDSDEASRAMGVPVARIRRAVWMGPLFGLAAGLALAAQLAMVRWQPSHFIPKPADRAAGAALIARIRSTPGEVWVPAHPWYAHLAGKRPFVHRMGMKDVTYANKWQVAGLTDWLRDHRFAAIFLDNHDIHTEFPIVGRYYRRDDLLDRSQQPRLYSGARGVMPESIWVPAVAQPPPEGAKVLFDFEKGNYAGWDIQGTAWGRAPDSQALPDQGPVRRWGGRYFASSMHGGDQATGTLVSPGFEITGDWITFRMSGGVDKESLIAELRVDGKPVRTASNPIASEKFAEQRWDVADLKGKTASLALVDHTSGAWGHLNFDEVLLWTRPPTSSAADTR